MTFTAIIISYAVSLAAAATFHVLTKKYRIKFKLVIEKR